MTLEHPTAFVSTGELPPPERVRLLMEEAHQRFASIDEGQPSQVYPALARVSPEPFGICVVGARGGLEPASPGCNEYRACLDAARGAVRSACSLRCR